MIPGIGIGIGFGGYAEALEARVKAIPGRVCWLRADCGVTLNSGAVSAWQDTSVTSGLTVTQAAAGSRPTVGTTGAGGKSYLLCGQTEGSFLAFGSGELAPLIATAAEAFFVFRRDSGADPGQGGLHSLYGNLNGCHIPYTDNTVYDAFYSNTRPSFAVTAGLMSSDVCLYNPRSTDGEWTAKVNSTQLHTTATNAYQESAAAGAYAGLLAFGTSVSSIYLKGQFYEFLLFNRFLSTTERADVEQYVRRRYAAAW